MKVLSRLFVYPVAEPFVMFRFLALELTNEKCKKSEKIDHKYYYYYFYLYLTNFKSFYNQYNITYYT